MYLSQVTFVANAKRFQEKKKHNSKLSIHTYYSSNLNIHETIQTVNKLTF